MSVYKNGLIVLLAICVIIPNGTICSTINRNLVDNIQTGINLAGKMLGFDAATDVAELVARAFAPTTTNRQSINDNEVNDGEDDGQKGYDSETSESETPGATSTTNTDYESVKGDNGFMGNILRVIGLDNGKLGALAINGIIFIAQIIGRSLMSTFGVKSPNLNYARNLDDATNPSADSPFDWIMEHQLTNTALSQQLINSRDKDLPQQVVQSIVNGALGDDPSNGQADCIKLLVCKSAPIIWGMQRAIFEPTNANDKTEDRNGNDNSGSDDKKSGNRLDEYFRYLPTVPEFKDHGDECEQRYNGCKIYS